MAADEPRPDRRQYPSSDPGVPGTNARQPPGQRHRSRRHSTESRTDQVLPRKREHRESTETRNPGLRLLPGNRAPKTEMANRGRLEPTAQPAAEMNAPPPQIQPPTG